MFTKVARVGDVQVGRSKKVMVGDLEIALWNAKGKIYAINNVCPHQHFSSLHEGTLEGICVTCPMHGWTFSLETGEATSGGGKAFVYTVEVRGDQVFVDI